MSAYVIAEVEITDPKLFKQYGMGVPATIARYGGRYLVRGGAVEIKEGGWTPKRVVILEFGSIDQARKWYDSPEYRPLIGMRLKSANTKLFFVEGV